MPLLTASLTLPIFAQETPSPGMSVGVIGGYALLFVAMYFFMIAPQRKKQKELQQMIDGLSTGDQILTTGGIYGEITNKKEDRFVVRIADGTKVEIGKAFVHSVVNKKDAPDSKGS